MKRFRKCTIAAARHHDDHESREHPERSEENRYASFSVVRSEETHFACAVREDVTDDEALAIARDLISTASSFAAFPFNLRMGDGDHARFGAVLESGLTGLGVIHITPDGWIVGEPATKRKVRKKKR